jgi:Zn-dependent protease with chaperone function
MYGFFKNKRIVLYDTLIGQCSEEQVVAVLAHELGEWRARAPAGGLGLLVPLLAAAVQLPGAGADPLQRRQT